MKNQLLFAISILFVSAVLSQELIAAPGTIVPNKDFVLDTTDDTSDDTIIINAQGFVHPNKDIIPFPDTVIYRSPPP